MKENQQENYSTVVGHKTEGQPTTNQYHVNALKPGIRIRGNQAISLKSTDE